MKILYLNQERSYKRKVKEAILSLKIQREQSKEEMLQGYLNTIYFGRGAYGIQAAAKAYFDKDAKDLSLRESAVLATVLNNPTRYDPANGKEAKQNLQGRYDYVLDGMAERDEIAAERPTRPEAAAQVPRDRAESTYGGQKGHLLAMVARSCCARRTTATTSPSSRSTGVACGSRRRSPRRRWKPPCTAWSRPARGLRRQGAARRRRQRRAGHRSGARHLRRAGLPRSQLNWAVAGGQAGSTFKPFAVAAASRTATRSGTPSTATRPTSCPTATTCENQGDEDYGSAVSLLKATEDSINTAFIDMTLAWTTDRRRSSTWPTRWASRRRGPKRGPGFPDETPGLEPNTGVALGSQTVSPINMANGYATIANGGVAMPARTSSRASLDADGETVYEHKAAEGERAVSADIAADTSYALQQVVEVGTGDAAQALGRPAAGKTGTATNETGDVSRPGSPATPRSWRPR